MLLPKIIAKIENQFSNSILDTTKFAGEDIIHIKGSSNLDILKLFKNNEFNFLADMTAIDNLTLGGFERFSVVYHLLSHETKERVTIKAYVPEDEPKLPSAESLWKTADWQEREIYDLFGILFKGHPNLIRIMNPDDYNGHPLRKDYPRLGRKERDDFPVVKRGINKDSTVDW
tara:strand:+ start:43 stop:561 length:519 start_codon:yes stop_codon:yes gene_type:complete